ncbi:MAG: hypothetical protein H6828_15570 [Planctomycetes bacterium]|nr:hypothetical protein [Planctomycetota bacterium]
MKSLLACLLVLSASLFAVARPLQAPDYEAVVAEAEAARAEGSFTLAHRAYERLRGAELDEARANWVAFRLADTRWRAAAASRDSDRSELDAAWEELEAVAKRWRREELHDETWALTQVSMGDFLWFQPGRYDWGRAFEHYRAALDHWAESTDLATARPRYLDTVRKIVGEPSESWRRHQALYGVPEDVLVGAASLAVTPDEVCDTNTWLAKRLANGDGRARTHARTRAAWEAAVAAGPGAARYEDALYEWGVWLEERGVMHSDLERGDWTEPDYVAALAVYRRLVEEFREGEGAHVRQAEGRIKNITSEEVALSVGNAFLPGSEVLAHLRWRNVGEVRLSLYALDLVRDVRLLEKEDRVDLWLKDVDAGALELARRWTHATEDDGLHRWGETELELGADVAPGAYLLEATAGRGRSRELVLVSDAALTVKTAGDDVLAWLAHADDGAPVADAPVRLFHRTRTDLPWQAVSGTTDAEGLARFEFPPTSVRSSYLLLAGAGGSQAFSAAAEPWRAGPQNDWRVHVASDRSAYRPGQLVQWKFTARRRADGRYLTPSGAALAWQLVSQTGETKAEGTATLNEFGSAWASVTPDAAWPLGLYSLVLNESKNGKPGARVASETFFRLEEYELPEFLVKVDVARGADGAALRYHPGDEVRATVQADYYFGGGVADATVTVDVTRRSFWPRFTHEREFPWFYEDDQPSWGWWGGPGEVVTQQTLRTDAQGRCEVVFPAQDDDGQDDEYTLTARVTDSSRREVAGSGTVRVTRQSWFAELESAHALHRPGDAGEVTVRVQDANARPAAVAGELALVRRIWRERWITPRGEVLQGHDLLVARHLHASFPPAPLPGEPAWRCEQRGYVEEVVTTTSVTTDAEGRAAWAPRLPREGQYLVRFLGKDERGIEVRAEVALWALDDATRELDTPHEGFQLVVDRDTLREGQRAALMITAPASGRTVLVTVESDALLETRVVHLTGTAQLLSFEVDERWLPNAWIQVVGLDGGEVAFLSERVVVPPARHFLDVEVAVDPPECEPGAEAALTVRVRDDAGRPVVGEVGVALVDESVAAIQEDLAQDPRRFFYGETRQLQVQTQSSCWNLGFTRLGRDAEGRLVETRTAWLGEDVDEEERDFAPAAELAALGYGGGAPRAGGGGRMSKGAAPSGPGAAGSDDFFLGLADEGGTFRGPGDSVPQGGVLVVEVRRDFRETALWLPDLVTDAEGTARATFRYPDSLTRWRAVGRALTTGAEFGEGRGLGKTRLPLSVRLQAPRFFVVGDEGLVSVNLDNRTDAVQALRVEFAVEGLEVVSFVDAVGRDATLPASVDVPAQDGLRLDWRVRAVASGTATFRVAARGAEAGDALERSLPVHAHGVPVLEARSGRCDGDGVDVLLPLPAARSAEDTEVVVQVTPSLAVTMLDALPYLVDYPYGCTEQTLSRFVPTVVVKRTLAQLGLDPEVALTRAFGGIEEEHVVRTQRKTKGSLERLDEVTAAGLERLWKLQHGDGSWSWWEHGEGDPFMTAYAVWTLSLARDAGVELDAARLDAGGRWLGERLVEAKDRPDLAAWMLQAHAAWLRAQDDERQRDFAVQALERGLAQRGALNAYGKALLCLAASDLGRADAAALLTRNLIDGVQRDEAPDASIVAVGHLAGGTQRPRAHWGEDGTGYRWSDGGVEATAFALMALVRVDPHHELVEPAADWLVANRRGAQWSNTKTTAIVVLALERYLAATAQLDREVGYRVVVNGTEVASVALGKDDLLRAPARHVVPRELLRDGENRVELRRTRGAGPLYFSVEARFTSLEEPVAPRGHELFVRRQYFRLVARPTLLRGVQYERVPLADGDELVSGERVEVVVTVEAKNHLEYLVFEDQKPAGLEAVQVKSGEALWARELRADEAGYRFGEAAATRLASARAGRRAGRRDERRHRAHAPGAPGAARPLRGALPRPVPRGLLGAALRPASRDARALPRAAAARRGDVRARGARERRGAAPDRARSRRRVNEGARARGAVG